MQDLAAISWLLKMLLVCLVALSSSPYTYVPMNRLNLDVITIETRLDLLLSRLIWKDCLDRLTGTVVWPRLEGSPDSIPCSEGRLRCNTLSDIGIHTLATPTFNRSGREAGCPPQKMAVLLHNLASAFSL